MTSQKTRPVEGYQERESPRVSRAQAPRELQRRKAISVAREMDKPLQDSELAVREEISSISSEELDQDDPTSYYLDAEGLSPDNDVYDFSEYDEDSPLYDPDDLHHLLPSEGLNPFDEERDDITPAPAPDIIIDEFGAVSIPREDLVFRYYGKAAQEGRLSPRARDVDEVARLLRKVGEGLAQEWMPKVQAQGNTLVKAELVKLRREDFMKSIGIEDKPVAARLAAMNVSLPYFGVMPLGDLFSGEAEEGWKKAVEVVIEELAGENPENPYSNEYLWNRISPNLSFGYANNRQFRNTLCENGIPLKKPRKDIYKYTLKWIKENKRKKINRSEIPRVHEDLLSLGLFSDGHGRLCREPQYRAFVEERIRAVLLRFGLLVSDEHPL
ncbi:MAG: hypothetical protein JW836_08780 [Deltaproteobacteria bacterium]|nr:hypothetical protein [Deltaproteobacteria bacterium]